MSESQIPNNSSGRCFHLHAPCPQSDAGTCDDCAFYAQVQTTAGTGSRLSAGLRQQLTNLPNRFGDPLERGPIRPSVMADAVRQVEEGTTPSANDLTSDELALHRFLVQTVEDHRRPRPMPATLATDLRNIARKAPASASNGGHRPLAQGSTPPWWILDSRWATAACALLTAVLTFSAGDASARFMEIQQSSQRLQQMSYENSLRLKEQADRWVGDTILSSRDSGDSGSVSTELQSRWQAAQSRYQQTARQGAAEGQERFNRWIADGRRQLRTAGRDLSPRVAKLLSWMQPHPRQPQESDNPNNNNAQQQPEPSLLDKGHRAWNDFFSAPPAAEESTERKTP